MVRWASLLVRKCDSAECSAMRSPCRRFEHNSVRHHQEIPTLTSREALLLSPWVFSIRNLEKGVSLSQETAPALMPRDGFQQWGKAGLAFSSDPFPLENPCGRHVKVRCRHVPEESSFPFIHPTTVWTFLSGPQPLASILPVTTIYYTVFQGHSIYLKHRGFLGSIRPGIRHCHSCRSENKTDSQSIGYRALCYGIWRSSS